jgi:hypothetical protein
MFRRAGGVRIGPMEIRIDVEAASPPAGRIRPPSGAPIPFAGWLSLMAALERVLEQQSTPAEERSPP